MYPEKKTFEHPLTQKRQFWVTARNYDGKQLGDTITYEGEEYVITEHLRRYDLPNMVRITGIPKKHCITED